ncbi:MAG: glycosyltransferase family 2 protein, partial [Bacteroidales bacterium]
GEEKDIFDKMKNCKLRFFYLPTPVLYHLIPETKLSKDYFYRLTYSIGKSERRRTLDISETKYVKRLFLETIKWGATLILFIYYTLSLSPQKGLKLIHFRWNVSKGLLGK